VRIVPVIGILLCAAAVGAADAGAAPSSAAPLTWADCVRRAALKNPDLLSAVRARQASRAQYLGRYNGLLPQLSLSNTYSDNAGAGDSRSRLWQAQGTASLDLIDLNQWASIRSAAASFRQSQANEFLASSTVLLSLYRAFASLLYTQEEIGVATHIRDLWRTNAEMIDLRYDSGRESKGNAMRTRAEQLQAEVSLKQAHRDIRVAQQQLGQALGEDAFSALAVTGTWKTPEVPATPPDLASLADRLPSVRAQAAAVDQAKAARSAARSALYPTLSVSYSRGVQDTSEFPTSNPSWTAAGQLSLPLFGGGPTAVYFNTASANRNLEKAQQDLRSVRKQALTAIETAWSGLAQAQDQVQVQSAFLKSAIQRKLESDVMYQAGLLSFQDWELIMTDYVNFQRSYLSAEQNLLSAEGQWIFAIGGQLGESL
jgi:outer membrane protein